MCVAPVDGRAHAPTHEISERPAWLFVGRGAQLSELRQAFSAAPAGGLFCLVSGEAGAGKSRLLAELHTQLPSGRR